jgi:predicted TIM-barrel fold metal-dependent hydrolase
MSAVWDTLVDESWLGRTEEPVLDPDAAIVDPHHHLWATPFPYDVPQLLADMRGGHRVVGTVYAEAHRGYRADGPEHLRPAGETAHITAIAEAAEALDHGIRLCAGIVGAADLTDDPQRLAELLDAHGAAGKGRFCGIRANIFITFHPATLAMMQLPGWDTIVDHPGFQAGARALAARGLALDTVCGHFQLPQVARLAGRIPDLPVVLNHLSPIYNFGDDAVGHDYLMAAWRRGIGEIATHPNIYLKLGGCANPMMAHSLPAFSTLRDKDAPPTSEQLAELYRPMVDFAIDRLGPSRCMFESNFPVDKWGTSYRVLWNAFKRLARPYAGDERHDLLMATAIRAYRLQNLPL